MPSPFCICSRAGKNGPPLAETCIEPRLARAEKRRKELAGAAPAKCTMGLVLAWTPVSATSPRSIVKGTAGDIEKLDQCHVLPAPAPVLTLHPGRLHAVASSGEYEWWPSWTTPSAKPRSLMLVSTRVQAAPLTFTSSRTWVRLKLSWNGSRRL